MELKNAKTSEDVRYCLNLNFKNSCKNAYHYTTLKTLYEIFSNKTLRFSQLSEMNDLIEAKFAKNCDNYFFCLTKDESSLENFGMWAMYGKINEYNAKHPTADKIGVKIQFPIDVIENLRNDFSLKFYAVGYGKILESRNSKIKAGSQTTEQNILLDEKELGGYIKDNSWKYENEFRLSSSKSNEKIQKLKKTENVYGITLSDEILKQLVVYPCPLSSKDECERVFYELVKKGGLKSGITPHFEKNTYERTYQFKSKKT